VLLTAWPASRGSSPFSVRNPFVKAEEVVIPERMPGFRILSYVVWDQGVFERALKLA